MISIIVPTCNRANKLSLTLISILEQDFSKEEYEVLIVDNKSTDNTKEVSLELISKYKLNNIKYIYEEVAGLLSARHRGVNESKGDICVFVDDDIIAEKGWLTAIQNAFLDQSVGAIGGKSIPLFESEQPFWLKYFFNIKNKKYVFGYYSLINLGDKVKEINPLFLYGLNMAFRKEIFHRVGGTNPDLMPNEFKEFTGDGESGFGRKLLINKIKTLYIPEMKVFHLVGKDRLTIDYLKKRQFYQGLFDSYASIRYSNDNKKSVQNVFNVLVFYLEKILKEIKLIVNFNVTEREVLIKIQNEIKSSYKEGYEFLQNCIKANPNLRKWILKENYFDYDFRSFLPKC
ncbi:MAG: glycosyltransferase family 2 protein [Ignavibacteriales bacterium]|nr:glycosyltransferase family 2 protein [Ignavibacteriales bacterium]